MDQGYIFSQGFSISNEALVKTDIFKYLDTKLKSLGLSLVSGSVAGKIKRSLGISFKDLKLSVSDEQILIISIKKSGDIYKVKIGNKNIELAPNLTWKQNIDHIAKQIKKGSEKAKTKRENALNKANNEIAKKRKSKYTKKILATKEQIKTNLEKQLADFKSGDKYILVIGNDVLGKNDKLTDDKKEYRLFNEEEIKNKLEDKTTGYAVKVA